ncbi:hypothetical protein [Pengzhenrongella phosphoraccumulans]|uniref:hypothetical protein n=1 Tax=Pengzhenrongella phosphoraccumulans TaxID=3114394 RepID=UPI00388F05E1
MGILVFLSRAEPYRTGQQEFLKALRNYLEQRGLEPHTVGETDFGMDGMREIRGLLMRSHGLLSVAFRKLVVQKGQERPDPDVDLAKAQQVPLENPTWLTSPWCHMETAMAFQLGLPILLAVEEGVRLEGVLEGGVLTQHPPTFKVRSRRKNLDSFFTDTQKWRQLSATWEGEVREVVRARSSPPRLFGCTHG